MEINKAYAESIASEFVRKRVGYDLNILDSERAQGDLWHVLFELKDAEGTVFINTALVVVNGLTGEAYDGRDFYRRRPT